MTSLSCQVKHRRGMPIGCPVEQANTFSYCLVQLSWILLFVAEQPVIEKIWQEKESLIFSLLHVLYQRNRNISSVLLFSPTASMY